MLCECDLYCSWAFMVVSTVSLYFWHSRMDFIHFSAVCAVWWVCGFLWEHSSELNWRSECYMQRRFRRLHPCQLGPECTHKQQQRQPGRRRRLRSLLQKHSLVQIGHWQPRRGSGMLQGGRNSGKHHLVQRGETRRQLQRQLDMEQLQAKIAPRTHSSGPSCFRIPSWAQPPQNATQVVSRLSLSFITKVFIDSCRDYMEQLQTTISTRTHSQWPMVPIRNSSIVSSALRKMLRK